jgi:hypothetical protein
MEKLPITEAEAAGTSAITAKAVRQKKIVPFSEYRLIYTSSDVTMPTTINFQYPQAAT